jgi:hypothetical protein
MRRFFILFAAAGALLVSLGSALDLIRVGTDVQAAEPSRPAADVSPVLPNLKEARGRARLLHEAIHGTLQVVHRDFFREDESLTIPSKSFEDVFSELEKTHHVQVNWLAVNAQAMSVDNKPDGKFEEAAVKALAAGDAEYESADEDAYQYAGAIRLSASCLSCHLPRRSSNDDRVAGLVIRMPLAQQE